jgi:hypothetical protein
MKNTQTLPIGRPLRSQLILATLLLAGATLLSGGRCTAQTFPGQGDDTTSSMGVFRITVDPAFRALVGPVGALPAYAGYNIAGGKLTSPLCIDGATTIGRSAPQTRPDTFPVPIGLGSWDTILGYGDYAAIPSTWNTALPPTEEVLTEIKSFILTSVAPGSDGRQCPPDPRIPSVPLSWPMVKAGTFAGVALRSLGMVQENTVNGPAAPDFPAHSFFDIFVDVSLPPIPGTESAVAFPAGGALLYNDSPLIITNLNLTSFPPAVVYIHGETTAVPLKFKTTHPPYWAAGDIFGYLVLAGHGTITNDCANTPVVNALLDAALGPGGASRPEMPVEWLRTNTLFPSPGSTYDAVMGTNSSGLPVDAIRFTVTGVGTFFARSLSLSNLTNPIPPPPPSATITYANPFTILSGELSPDGVNWGAAQANGPLLVKISNTTGTGSTSTFDTEMLQLNLSGNSPFGPFMLRESPTLQSLGRHTIRSDPRGFRVSSFFDVFLELSVDGGATWTPANRSMRIQSSSPPAAPNSIFASPAGPEIALNWMGTFTLQSSTNIRGPFADIAGPIPGPFNVPIGPGQKFFRLRQ